MYIVLHHFPSKVVIVICNYRENLKITYVLLLMAPQHDMQQLCEMKQHFHTRKLPHKALKVLYEMCVRISGRKVRKKYIKGLTYAG